jgi:UDP-2,3-diacylglucosamine hydrolase
MADRPVFFISDAHLGSSARASDDEPRLERLIPFLRSVIDRKAERLYIVGDLFDFWFEYRHVMPWRHFRILAALREVTAHGIPVHFLGGNHDWWAGDAFREVAGLTVHHDAISVDHQGLRLRLHHGDGLASGTDSGYLFLKAVLRNRWTIRLLRLVHPDLAYAFGYRLSRFSRTHLTSNEFHVSAPLGAAVDAELANHDAFLMGHLHARYRERRPGGELFILGDWMTIFSALRLEDGGFTWEDWSTRERRDVPIDAPTAFGGHGDEPVPAGP